MYEARLVYTHHMLLLIDKWLRYTENRSLTPHAVDTFGVWVWVWGRTCITVDNHLILPTNLSINELVSALEDAFS